MNHPFLRNRFFLLIYSGIWILISGIHILVLTVFYKQPLITGITESIVFNGIFFILGFSLWYVVQYNKPDKANFFNSFINHLTIAAVFLLVWYGTSYGIVHVVLSKSDTLIGFIQNSALWQIISGFLLYIVLLLSYFVIEGYENLQERLKHENKLMNLVKQAELDSLRSQINPHFLFNSLNSISSLTLTKPDQAHEMIIKLSDFLRYTISQASDTLTDLEKEIKNIERYLQIEKVKFGNKLQYVNTIPEPCLGCSLPVFILQPLYENAVKHGVYESSEPVLIETTCSFEDDLLKIRIVNNFDKDFRNKKGSGIGLTNIRERLRLVYHSADLLQVHPGDGSFEVKLFIPQTAVSTIKNN
jgi:sensor histidine kinase YesM